MVNQTGPLQQVLRKARQRCVTHLALDAVLLAVAVSCGAAALVLLAGTDMLGFYWIAIAAVASVCAGIYLLRKHTPAEYVVAQRIDERLELADTISTASYFADTTPGISSDSTIRALQHRRAEEVARTVDVAQALPLVRPRMLVPAAVLAVVALGVFLFRFAVTGSFDPRASLIKNAITSLFGPPGESAKTPPQKGSGDQAGDDEQADPDVAQNNDFAGDPASEPPPLSADVPTDQVADGKEDPAQNEANDAAKMNSPEGDPAASENKDKEGDPQNSDKKGQENQDPSLMDKVKQAVSDMLNKMKPQPGDSKGQTKKSDPSKAKPQQSDSRDDSQGDDAQDSSDDDDGAKTQEDSKTSSNKQSKDQPNGAGSNEGDKAQRAADALKAMGKISELLGKRAENVTGAMMVEVGSTKQQMKTPIAQSGATHVEAGSEIHRDEVPPMYEQFVQQYFEQIRKTPAGNTAPAKTGR